MKTISILIPAYNEEESLPIFFPLLCEYLNSRTDYHWEVLFVNDGSVDETFNLLCDFRKKDLRFNYLDLSRNYGKEVAMLAGMDYVTGDAVVIMDADMQHPIGAINEMIVYWEQGYEDVYATRYLDHSEGFIKRTTSKIYYKCLQKITKVYIPQNTGDFRLLSRKCINAIRQMRESQRNTKAIYSLIGFKKKQIFYKQEERLYGTSKWRLWQLLSLAIDGISSFTIAPLKISFVLGCFISILSFLYMLFVIIKTVFWGEQVTGFPTLIVIILFLGGVQLLSMGIIGEYVGRIFYETKHRPLYFVNTYNGDEKTP